MLVGPSVIGILLTPLVYGRTGGPSWSDGSTLGSSGDIEDPTGGAVTASATRVARATNQSVYGHQPWCRNSCRWWNGRISHVREDFQLGRSISTPGAEWDSRRPGRGIRPLTRDVDSPSWCFVTARDALKEDSIVGDAAQVVVTAEAAECFMHQHGERPRYRTDLELVTVKYQPGMNVYQHESPP
jgi:hypothetical protein